MLLLPGSLPADRGTLKALCERLPANAPLAAWMRSCDVEAFDGSWGDAERACLARSQSATSSASVNPANPAPAAFASFASSALASPLHAALGLTDVTPSDPSLLQLADDDSRLLCNAVDALMREEGVHIEYVEALRWRVECEREIEVLTERPDWIIGESLRPNLPRGRDARLVERWMNEMQMLLFNHPVNEARQNRGLPAINMIWLWGFVATTSAVRIEARPNHDAAYDTRMLTAFRNGDLPSWQRAWSELTPRILASDVVIIGDSRPRLKLTAKPASFASKIASIFVAPRLADVLLSLSGKAQ
jgi:hypothetical protein